MARTHKKSQPAPREAETRLSAKPVVQESAAQRPREASPPGSRRRHLPKRVRADTRDDTGHTDHWLAKIVNRTTPHGTAQYSECQCVNESDLYWIQAPLQVD